MAEHGGQNISTNASKDHGAKWPRGRCWQYSTTVLTLLIKLRIEAIEFRYLLCTTVLTQAEVSWLLVIELKFSSFSLVCEFTINISGYTVLIFANQA